MSRKFYPSLALGLGLMASGCASGTLSRLFSRSEPLPQEVPKEMQEKFEVRDEAEARSPSVPGAPSASRSSARGGTKDQDRAAFLPARASRESLKARSPSGGRLRGPGQHGRGRGMPPGREALASGKRTATDHFVGPLPFSYPDRRPAQDPIWLSEKLVYDVSYFGVRAGDFVLETLPYKYVGGRRVYHIRGTAHTSKVFGLFYMLNDMAESYLDYAGIFSHRFHIVLNESKQVRDSIELYDSQKQQTFYWNRWERKGQPKVESKIFNRIDSFPQDTLSSLYYLRTVPLPDGGVVEFPVVSEGNTVYARVSVVRRETLDTVLGRVRCVVLKPEAKTHGVLTRKGDSYMWLTDDDRRYLVRLEAKVKVGTVVATLKEVEPGIPPDHGTPSPASVLPDSH